VLAVSPDGGTLAVTSAWEPALTAFDMDFVRRNTAALPRAPRGVLVDKRGRAFVTHLVGAELSVVPLDAPSWQPDAIALGVRAGSPNGKDANLRFVRKGSQAYGLASVEVFPRRSIRGEDLPRDPVEPQARLVVPLVSVDPGQPDQPTEFYYGPPPVAGVGKAAPMAVVVDPETRRSLSTHVVASTGGTRAKECQIPRAVAAHPKEPKIFVACVGLDELLELDARSADPMRAVRRRFPLPSGPTGVAIAAGEDVALVYGQFDNELAVVPLDDRPALSIRLAGSDPQLSAAAQHGRSLFYRSDDLRITRDGLACSSCHPDGTEDSLTWITPDGPRQTIMLAGRVSGTAPYGWTRNQPKLGAYIADTCQRLGGTGLGDADLDDLVEFLTALPRPPAPRAAHSDRVAQGREVFLGRGCGTCHQHGTGTDAMRHQLGRWEKEPIDTPSLKDVGRTAPYFHDGRYLTLEALLADKDSRMGATASLSDPERDVLRAYLESL
jgi:mono/diheme cytochrome c family protein